MHFCEDCGEERPVSEFEGNAAFPDGLGPYCATHRKARFAAWVAAGCPMNQTFNR